MPLSVGELVAYLRLESGTFDRGITTAQRGLDLTGASATKMGESVVKGETALKGAGKTAETVAAQSGKLRAAQLSAVAAQERYNTVLEGGGASAGKLASAEAALIRANDRLATSSRSVAASIEAANKAAADSSFSNGLKSRAASAVETAAKFGLMLGGFELAMKGLEFAKSGAELTTALNGVQAASHGTTEQMARARTEAIALGKDLTIPKATAVDAAAAMDDLVKSGVSLDRAMAAARPTLLLASAAQVQTADSARVLGDTLDDFHLKADQAGHVANVLAAAANSAGGGLMDLFDGLKYAGPTARTVGMDVTTTAAALVELAKSGMQGSLGGTALQNMLTRLNPTAKAAKAALAELGVSAYDAKGQFVGFPVVLDQLHAAQNRLNPQQFGQAVQTAFGARAKNAVLNFAVEGSAGFDKFYKAMQAGNVQDYADKMNRGLSAAGAQLRKEVTSWAIDIYGKVEPALTAAAFWFGDKLPSAIALVQHTLQPLEQELGSVLVPTFHAAVAVLKLLVGGLGEAGHELDSHRQLITVVGTAVLGMWAAYKGYTVVKTAVAAVSTALEALRNRAELAGESMVALKAGEASISSTSIVLGGLGLALGVAAYAWEKHASQVRQNKAEIESLTQAIISDNGALGGSVRAVLAKQLADKNAYETSLKAGIGQKDLTDAVMAGGHALNAVDEKLRTYQISLLGSGGAANNASRDVGKLRDELIGQNGDLSKAAIAARDQALAIGSTATAADEAAAKVTALETALTYTVDASGNLVQGQAAVGSTVNDTTQAMVKQKTAAELLKDSLDTLNGINISVETSTNAFLDSLDTLGQTIDSNAKSFGDSGKAMAQNTAEGRKNREGLVTIIQAAKDQAQAIADSVAAQTDMTTGLKAGNTQLSKNEDAIRKAAHAAGLSDEAVNALIKSIGKLSTVKANPKVDVDTKAAKDKLDKLLVQIGTVNGKHYQFFVDTTTQGITLPNGPAKAQKAGGGGVDGPGTATSDSIPALLSKGEHVLTADDVQKAGGQSAIYRLRQLIQSGAAKFATGGAAGAIASYTAPTYATKSSGSGSAASNSAAVAAAKALAAARDAIRFSAIQHDLPGLVTAVTGTAKSINSAMSKLINDVHQAALKGLGNDALVGVLGKENKQLQAYANQRAAIAVQVKAQNAQLASLRAASAAEQAKVADKINSEFDIGTAGASSNGFTASASPESIIKELQAKVAATEKFTAQLAILKSKGLDKSQIQILGEEGVTTAGANVNALAGASGDQIKAIDALTAKMNAAAQKAGKQVSGSMYDSGIQTAIGFIKGLSSQDAQVKTAASHLASLVTSQIRKDLGIHSPAKVPMGDGANVGEGFAIGIASKGSAVQAASKSLSNAAVKHLSDAASVVKVGSRSSSASGGLSSRNDNRPTVTNQFTIIQRPNEDGAALATRVGLFVTARSA
ncbi:MAG: hypothetical protein QOH56_2782 [Pseudonocardiales bacterium]|nr:hypothetical protein [Pseudonocardiales bacterium]